MSAAPEDVILHPDQRQAEAHLAALDETAETFTFQTFDDDKRRKDRRIARVLHGDLDDVWSRLAELNAQGAGIFVTVNETDGTGRKLDNIIRARAVFQEDDGDGKPLPLEPHITIESSPGKFHRYLLVEGLGLDEFDAVQATLVEDYGSDPNAKDRARVLRLAGFYHRKGEPHQVRIVDTSSTQPYPADQVRLAFPTKPKQESEPTPEPRTVDAATLAKVRKLAFEAANRTIEDGTRGRHAEVYLLGNILRREGLPGEPAVFDEALRTFEANMRPCDTNGEPTPLDWTAERKAIEDAYRTPNRPDRTAEHAVLQGQPTEDDVALIFSKRFADGLRFVALWSKWLMWNGTTWTKDETLTVWDEIRRLCRQVGSGAKKEDRAQLLKAKTVAAVHNLAKTDRRHAATVDQWDANDWALNTPGGIVDLRTGKIAAHDPSAYCTKITAAAPGGDCPMWLRFLRDVTDGDGELIGYLQRLAGYGATGSVREHMLAFLYGTGRNGKGVFLNTLQGVLADYAVTAAMDVFTESKHDRHPTELADLVGARLVVAQETDEGRHWDEAKLKTLTGGDPIKARYMRQDFFQFSPKFTLLIAGNHKPRLRNIDEAMRARLNLVPFTITIPKAKRDPELTEKLRAEYSGILAWIIRGTLEYQRIGLAPPPIVTAATAQYLAGEDLFAQRIEDECEFGPDKWDTSARLFDSWKRYAEAAGEKAGTRKGFADRVETAGYSAKRGGKGIRGYDGITLKPKPVEHGPRDYWE